MTGRSKPLEGILPAPITPLDPDGSVRLDLFEKQIEYLGNGGVHGFFVTGTTAEGSMISSEERCSLFQIMKERTTERHLRCVVVVQPDTPAVLRGIDEIAAFEPDYISAVSPFYVSVSQQAIIGHYTQIAEHSPVPVLLYNIPQNTHNPLSLDTILELAEHPNIVGIKDSSGNFVQFQRGILAGQPSDFTWIQGEDLLDAPSLMLGCRCIVTGLGNAWIDPYVAMFQAAVAGSNKGIIAEQQRVNALARIIFQTGGSVIPSIKTAAALQGRATPHMRVASTTLRNADQEIVASVIQELGLI
jgi:4-hydroxy-tetrahydrodipicolinate synthase